MRQPRTKARKWLERILLLGGLLALNIWVWSIAFRDLYEHWQSRTFSSEISNSGKTPQIHVAENELVGRLKVDRLGIQSIIREGAGEETLRLSLGHIPGTAFPGQPGNVGIAGHRDAEFRALRDVKTKDLIEVQTSSGKYVYSVESTQIVKPTDVTVLNAASYPELTLVTCYPFYYVGSAPDRFIVKARQITPMHSPEKRRTSQHRSKRKTARYHENPS